MQITFANTYKTYEEAIAVKAALKVANFADVIHATKTSNGEFEVTAEKYPADRMEIWN